MDADDLLIPVALEKLYAAAKKFDADVVYCEKFYELNLGKKIVRLLSQQSGDFVDKPTLETENLAQRIRETLRGRYWVTAWSKLTRRRLMIDHEIFFPQICPGEDNIWTYGLIFCAKKFLRVPNVVYVYRANDDSIMGKSKPPAQGVNFSMNPVLLGVKALDDLMAKVDFFQKNPRYRYAMLEFFAVEKIFDACQYGRDLPPFTIYETLKKEFGDALGAQDVLVSMLCTYAMTLQKNNYLNSQEISRLSAQLKAELAKKN